MSLSNCTPEGTSGRETIAPCLEASSYSLFAPPRQFDPQNPELIDRPDTDAASIREELRVLEVANRRFGGHHLVLEYLQRLLGSNRPATLSVLDLGTGGADIPRAIAAWCRSRQIRVSVTAVDVNPGVLRVAGELCREWPEVRLEQLDMLSLKLPPGSFDIVLCSLALHHFSSTDAVRLLRRMSEISKIGFIVNDLRRNWFSLGFTELLARLVFKSDIVRQDGPQSFRSAFTIDELRALAREAGLSNCSVRRHHAGFRMVLEGRK
jgi:ubiquinone/menaquinone biosynthesis C-methylase UbiE